MTSAITRLWTGSVGLALAVLVAVSIFASRPEPVGAAYPGNDGLIAFQRVLKNNKGGFTDRIVTVNDNGGKLNAITPRLGQFASTPEWSPDGKRIAFSRDGRIYTMNEEGRDLERVTGGKRFNGKPFDDSSPSWSPDGEEIVFFRQHGSGLVVGRGFDLFVIDADGSNLRPFVTGDLDELEPAWSPDGEWIAFTALGFDEPDGIYRMRPNGTERQLLLEVRDMKRGLDWSPDGQLLAFAARLSPAGAEIHTMRQDGTQVTELTSERQQAFEPAFSPRGDRIVYTVKGVLKLMDADGGDPSKLLKKSRGEGDLAPSWQPK